MNMFKSPKWDADAENDAFQELFQKTKIKSTSISHQKKKADKLKNKIKKKVSNGEATKLINANKVNETLSKSKKKRLKKRNKKLELNNKKDNFNEDVSLIDNKKSKKKKIKKEIKNTINTVTESVNNIVKKVKNKKLKKYSDNENEAVDNASTSTNKKKKKIKSKLQNIIFHDESLTEKLLPTSNISLREKKKQKNIEKLRETLNSAKQKKPVLTLRQKMMEKLKAARFRFINEQIYTADSKEAQKIFKNDPDAFKAYHEGYRKQVKSWSMNPLDVIIDNVKKMPKNYIIADFGCGDARLSKSVSQKVHSFDLVATDDTVVACDMSKVPLDNNSVDVVVFCLSLMGTNLRDYLFEANRVLKIGGILKVAEVESRFENVDDFIKGVQHFGFKNTWKDLNRKLFYFMDFKKERDVKNKNKLPTLSLLPCLYKKR